MCKYAYLFRNTDVHLPFYTAKNSKIMFLILKVLHERYSSQVISLCFTKWQLDDVRSNQSIFLRRPWTICVPRSALSWVVMPSIKSNWALPRSLCSRKACYDLGEVLLKSILKQTRHPFSEQSCSQTTETSFKPNNKFFLIQIIETASLSLSRDQTYCKLFFNYCLQLEAFSSVTIATIVPITHDN